ncbi:MAG: DeoR/GlpR family DNA-binding transcription regulator [Rhodobacteraceae bacterium]|jgi:DeoR/GlpR family transcriptional regulator of sugar metabolism|nr:DeoR/GlpR family DNA-binding transcription regulator [Paracoccaceae bacterium]
MNDRASRGLTAARRARLLDRLDRDGALVVTPLAAELGLSEDTLRRDLRDLAAEGRLMRVHGGAVPLSPTHAPMADRRAMQADAKARLVRAAAGMIADGALVIVDGGTTHMGLADALPPDRACTIVTHSPAIAASFEHRPRVEVVLVGGRLFRHSMVAMGPGTAAAFGSLRADLCLLGVTGVHAHTGLSTGDSEEAALKRLMVQASAETVVLATPDKIGRASAWTIGPLSDLSVLVTTDARPAWLPVGVAHVAA